MSKTSDTTIGLLRRLRFRFGFIVQRRDDLGAALSEELLSAKWCSRRVGDFIVWSHPETRIETYAIAGDTLVFIGDVYVETGDSLEIELDRLPDIDQDTIGTLLDLLSGRFALLTIHANRMRVYHDPIGSRSVYYHNGVPLAVSSHAALTALAVRAERCPEMAQYMSDVAYRKRRNKYLPGDRTVYQSVLGLPPNMLFDSDLMAIRRYWPTVPLERATLPEFNEALYQSLSALARYVKYKYTPTLGLTGGVDSRAVLAVFMAEKIALQTVTWNEAMLIPGEPGLIDQLVTYLGITHTYLKQSDIDDQIGRLAAINDGGIFLRPSKLCSLLRKHYRSQPDAVLLRGWGGEIARVFYNRRAWPMQSLSAKEMTRIYLSRSTKDNIKHPRLISKIFRRNTEHYFAEFAERCGSLAVDNLGYDPNDIFYWEHRMGMWAAAAVNETDAALPSLTAYNSRRLYASGFGLPPKQRQSKRLLLDLVSRCDPILGQIPVTRPSESFTNKMRDNAIALVRGAGGSRRHLPPSA